MPGRILKIRNYSGKDFDEYLKLHVESAQLAPAGRFVSAQNLIDDLGRPNFKPQTDLWVADLNGKLVGSLSINREPEIGRALLDGCVHPLHRRTGIATKLFSAALQHIRTIGIKSAQINIQESNTAAKYLMDKIGFTFIRYLLKCSCPLTASDCRQSVRATSPVAN